MGWWGAGRNDAPNTSTAVATATGPPVHHHHLAPPLDEPSTPPTTHHRRRPRPLLDVEDEHGSLQVSTQNIPSAATFVKFKM